MSEWEERRTARVDRVGLAIWQKLGQGPYSEYRYRPAAEAAIGEMLGPTGEPPFGAPNTGRDIQRVVARRLETIHTDLMIAGWSGDVAMMIIVKTILREEWEPEESLDGD